MRFLAFLSLALILAACSSLVPADTPAQLEATAGFPILVDDERVDAGSFILDYPDGWRLVKLSLAGDPITLALVAPDDNDTQIQVSEIGFPELEATIDANYYERFDSLEANGKTIYLWGQFPITRREEYDPIFEALRESIRFP